MSHHDRYLLELLDTLARQIERQVTRLGHETHEELETFRLIHHELHLIRIAIEPPPRPTTASITVLFSGDSATMPSTNSLSLLVGQKSQASIQPLAADGSPSGGSVSSVSFSFSDPSATVALNADGVTATVTGVAASTGPVSGTASCAVTDTDGAISTWSQPFTIQTSAATPPPPEQLTQSVVVQFSDPA